MLSTVSPYPNFFDIDGDPLDDGEVFYGVVNQNPETTPVAVFWDAAGTQPAAQPIKTLNGFLVRNGTPALVYTAGDYSISVRNARGLLVYTAASSAQFSNTSILQALIAAIYTDFANSADVTKGDALVAVKQPFTGSVARTQHDKNADFVSPEDFGAKGDSNGTAGNGTDDTAAVQAAINAVTGSVAYGKSAGGEVRFTAGKAYYIAGTLLCPSFLVLNLNGATLVGTSSGAGGNTVLATAYYAATVITNNAGNYTGAARLAGLKIKNGTVTAAGLGALLTQFGEGCELTGVNFPNCYHAFDADFSFYDGIRNVMARGTSASWAYRLRNNPNVQTVHEVFSVGNNTGFIVDQKAYSLTFLSCSVEAGVNGIQLLDEAYGFSVLGCYFELLTGKAIDLGDIARKGGVTIDHNFFDSCAILCRGRSVNGFNWGEGNYRNSATCIPGTIDVQTDTAVAPAQGAATGVWRSRAFELMSVGNSLPTLPAYLSFNSPMEIDACKTLISPTAGLGDAAFAKARLNTKIVPMDYSGKPGSIPFDVPFATVTRTGVAPNIIINIDTEILTDGYNLVPFRFDVADNVGVYKIFGIAYGTDVDLGAASAAGKTVTIVDNAGKMRIQLGLFSHPVVANVAVTGRFQHA